MTFFLLREYRYIYLRKPLVISGIRGSKYFIKKFVIKEKYAKSKNNSMRI